MSILIVYVCDKWWPLYIIDNDSLSSPLLTVEMAQKEKIETDDADMEDGSPTLEASSNEKKREFVMSKHFEPTTKPQPLKFSVLFSILWSTLILFILAAGPKAITILGKPWAKWWVFVLVAIGSLLIMGAIGYFIEPYFRKKYIQKQYKEETSDAEKFNNMDYFTLLLVVASAAFSFAHGGNDVANVLGPFGQIFEFQKNGYIESGASIPLWLSAIAGAAIGLGFILFGKRVLETVGKDIADVTYQTGFIAQYSAALSVLICDVMALPVSSSTVIVGAVYGIQYYNKRTEKKMREKFGNEETVEELDLKGMDKCLYRMKQLNLDTLGKIISTWIITLPANAGLCAAIYAIINAIWG